MFEHAAVASLPGHSWMLHAAMAHGTSSTLHRHTVAHPHATFLHHEVHRYGVRNGHPRDRIPCRAGGPLASLRSSHRDDRGFVAAFIEGVQSQGRLTFSSQEVETAGGPAGEALVRALHREQAIGRIQRLSRKSDFFIIVPPEYRALGAPPVEWWLDDAMNHLGLPYYVGLLTAAQWHGSSHFALMETQVVVPKNRRPLKVGRARIRFFASEMVVCTPVERRTGLWASVQVSTPAATLLDLIRHQQGGMDRVAMIAADLATRTTTEDLSAALDAVGSVPSAQRLGYIFEQVDAGPLADVITGWIDRKPIRMIDLDPGAGVP